MTKVHTGRMVAGVVTMWVVCGTAAAADWPGFRGGEAAGVGQGSGYAAEWNRQSNVTWRTVLDGEGWSSPVAAGGRVYLTSAVQRGGRWMLHALCLDAATGSILWNREVFSEDRALGTTRHEKNSRASATPVVEGDHLYVHFGNQGIACLTTGGEPVWSNRSLRYEPVHGNGGSPIVFGDRLILSCDGADEAFVVALDKATGRQVWRTDRGVRTRSRFSFSTPLAIEVDDRTQVVSAGSGAVYGYDPTDGRVIWGVGYGEGYSVVPQPVYEQGLLYVCTGFNRASLLAIRPRGARGDVTQSATAWSTNRAAPLTPTPVAAGGDVFMVSDQGVATCLDAKTGDVQWQQRIGGNYSASPVIAEGRVYFPSEDGEVVVVAASREFRELARNSVGERIFATPALVDGAIYLRTDAALYRIGPVASVN